MSVVLLVAITLAGCVTPRVPPSPFAGASMDLTTEDWTIREGEAVWKTKPAAAGITGELFVALNPDGRRLVKFTRAASPIVTVEIGPNGWQVDYAGKRRALRGVGALPDGVLWLQFPGGLIGDNSTTNWYFARTQNDRWHFENLQTEEALDGALVTTRLPRLHLVRAGETINRIARIHGVTAAAVRAANPGAGANWIHPGAVVRLPSLAP